jgi:hypothetical protein
LSLALPNSFAILAKDETFEILFAASDLAAGRLQ